ncbi:hypothetical protein ACFLTP_04345 [Chloroflexota bacterium]
MKTSTYVTWYDFKKDLEKRCHYPLEPSVWLRVKPKASLPWSGFDLRLSYHRLLDLRKPLYDPFLLPMSESQQTTVTTP